jgi:RND family efflux transporter MFP subunit
MRVCLAGFLSVALCSLSGCNKEQAKAPEAKPPVVLVSYPEVREVIDYEEVTGRTDAKPSVEIRPRVSGYLVEVPFKEGAVVKEKALLYKINPEQYKADLDNAEAKLEQGKARVQQLEADFERATEIRNRNAIAKSEYDKTRADRLDAIHAVKAYEAMLKKAKINLDYTTIEAPFDGRVSRSMLDVGNLVKADETLLTTIVALDPMFVFFDVDERTWLRLLKLLRERKVKSYEEGHALAVAHVVVQAGGARGLAPGSSPLALLAQAPIAFGLADAFGLLVQMGLADEEGFPHHGVIDFAENKLDAGTGTMRMRARFRNPNGMLLTPGMFVRLRVAVGTSYPAVLVPDSAFGTDQGQRFLYVINEKASNGAGPESYVEYRKVKTGALHAGGRVIEEGLKLTLRPRSFEMLRTEPVPEDVVKKLRELEGHTFDKAPDFIAALNKVLSKEELDQYQSPIGQAALEKGGKLTLRPHAFQALRTERVSDDVLAKIEDLQDKSFEKLPDFLKVLSKKLSKAELKRYQIQIAQAALEKVIVNGLQRARPDAKVEPKTVWEQAANGKR